MIRTTIILLFVSIGALAQGYKTISFKSDDGVVVTADLYMMYDKTKPFIVLFHQANWSRGEYLEIAPELNKLGYNCMAVDLRSGGSVNNVNNQTMQSATSAMKETKYVNSIPDIAAAIEYADEYYADGKLIIWGSSYSSSLVLHYAGSNPGNVDAVMSFSPGEYFRSQGKPADFVTSSAKNITIPVFITSAKSEENSWRGIYEAIPSESKEFYLPDTPGNHGSRALWSKFGDSLRYWDAVEAFLEKVN